jgi:hypothetical protein
MHGSAATGVLGPSSAAGARPQTAWRAAHDDATLQRVADRLDADARERLDALLADEGEGTAFARLAADPGRIGLESLLIEIDKLERLRALALPTGLLRGLHPDLVRRFRRRAAVETAWEPRRHPERIRLPLLALWCAPREAEVVDGLVIELLIGITHRITVRAERRVLKELMEEAIEVRGKSGILFRVAEAAVGAPGGVVRCPISYRLRLTQMEPSPSSMTERSPLAPPSGLSTFRPVPSKSSGCARAC